jgi:GMP synthase (glutamine-hydrolysing)
MEFLTRVANRIVNEVRGGLINRVTYDITLGGREQAAAGTIEWE